MSHTPFSGEQRKILALTLLPVFMTLLSVSIVNVVLPSLQSNLGASDSELQWVLTGYALSFAMVLVASGRAGDIFGRGQFFLIGNALFGVGSLVAGLAHDPLTVNIARVVMGVGSGCVSPQVVGVLQQFFIGVQRGKAFGFLGGTIGVSVAIGPVLGGVLVQLYGDSWGWRTAFLINVPIVVYAILMAKPWFPASAWRGLESRADLDPIGTLLFGAAVLLTLLPFVEHDASALIWLCVPAAAVCAGAWVLWERRYRARGRAPMVDLALFRTRSFANGTLIISTFLLGTTSLWVLLALYMQRGLGESALAAGLIGLPAALASTVASPLAGLHVMRLGRPLVIAGIGVTLAGLLGCLVIVWGQAHLGWSVWWLAGTLALVGAGIGMVNTPNQTLSLMDVPLDYAGSAGGVLQTGQRVGTSVGIALITGVTFSALAGSEGNWSHAFGVGLILISGIVAVSGGLGLLDYWQHRRGYDGVYGSALD